MSLETTDQELLAFLAAVVDDLRSELGDALVAAILHGSLAMGSFYPPKSDIDLLVIVRDLTPDEARRLYGLFERHHALRPYAGGLEVSVIREADASAPKHPLPFLVHFSETTTGWQTHSWQGGTLPRDEDLLAHLTVARHRGRSLHGPGGAEAIGPLSWDDYLTSVRGDIEWILEDENILKSPFYGILNLCRWTMMADASDRIVPGKEEAGEWAISHLPESQAGIVAQALAAYRGADWPRTMKERQLSGGPWRRESLIEFRDHMRSRLALQAMQRNDAG